MQQKLAPNSHVLIVEDAPDLQLLLGRILERQGYRVSKAFNGQEALDFLQSAKERPQFILLDVMMPVMDGLEFRERQRNDAELSGIPVVAMTAATDPQNFAQKMGLNKILRKPIAIDELLSTLANF